MITARFDLPTIVWNSDHGQIQLVQRHATHGLGKTDEQPSSVDLLTFLLEVDGVVACYVRSHCLEACKLDIFAKLMYLCGSVAEWLESRTCDQQVADKNPGCRAAECNPGHVVYTHVPLSPSSIVWNHTVAVMLGGRLGR